MTMTNDDSAEGEFTELLTELLKVEDARKASLETRALAAITVNLSLVTIYIAASAHSGFIADLATGGTSVYLTISFVAVLLGVVLAFAGAMPFSYGTFTVAGLAELDTDVAEHNLSAIDLRSRIRVIRMEQLKSYRQRNKTKVVLLFAASAASAVAVFLFVLAVIIAV